MKKVNKKTTRYTVSKFCTKCGRKTVHSLFDRKNKTLRCNICGNLVTPLKAKVTNEDN